MAKEIKIQRQNETNEVPILKNISDALPVGATINGVTKAKTLTDYEYIDGQEQLERDTKLKEDMPKCLLTKNEEKTIEEKFGDGAKINELLKNIEALAGEYEPGSDIDKKKDTCLKDELKIIKYFAKQYRENVKKLFSEMADEDISNILGADKKEEIDEIIEEMVRPTYHRSKRNNKESLKSGVPSPIIESMMGSKYISPECKTAEEPLIPGDFDGICCDLMALHARKNKDYGNAAHESYKEFGLISYVIRLNDKMNRLKSLTKPGVEQEVKSESIEDTLMDLAAYAIMAIESLRS